MYSFRQDKRDPAPEMIKVPVTIRNPFNHFDFIVNAFNRAV